MKRVYRAHPLMILSLMKPYILFVVITVLGIVLKYLSGDRILNTSLISIGVFAFVLLTAVIRTLCFRLILEEGTITVRKGFLLVKRATIDISNLASFRTRQNPLDVIFRAATVRINTEAGTKRRPDFEFKLSLKNSRTLTSVLYIDKTESKVRFSPFKVAILAAASSSSFTGLFIGVPIINCASQLLGVGLNRMLFDEINSVSTKFETYFPPIVNAASLVLIIAYAISFFYTLVKYINFKLYLCESSLVVKSGFFVRQTTLFKKSAINNVKIVQSPLMMLFRRYSMKVSVGGFSERRSASQIIIPADKHSGIREDLYKYFPFLSNEQEAVIPKRCASVRNRFFFWPTVCLLTVTIAAIICGLIFTDFGRFIFFLTTVAFSLIIIFAYVGLYGYTRGKLQMGDSISAQGSKGFTTCELYCSKENIGQIKITRIFADKKQNTCNVKLIVSSESADSISVNHINFTDAMKQIQNCYNFKE